jgi:imidazolonepropionase-like amidohydrolase
MLIAPILLLALAQNGSLATSQATEASAVPIRQAPIWALKPTSVILPDGSSAAGAIVLVQGDRILGVGTDLEIPSSAQEISFEGVLAPGFVDAFSAFGTDSQVREDSRRLSPMLRAFDAVNFKDNDDWKALREAGITTIQVLPEPRNVQAGWGALVTTGGDRKRTLAGRTRQVLSLVMAMVQDRGVGPTSVAGAAELLKEGGTDRIPGLQEHGAVVHVQDAAGVRAARAVLGEVPARWMMWGDSGSYGGELRGQNVGLQLPARGSWSPRTLENLKRLHKAGLKICFGTWSPTGKAAAGDLRRNAILLARLTRDPAGAFASITTHAADFAGSTEIGAIAAGKRADLVLWSAHPLDATARIRAVMIGGQTVYRAPAQEQ